MRAGVGYHALDRDEIRLSRLCWPAARRSRSTLQSRPVSGSRRLRRPARSRLRLCTDVRFAKMRARSSCGAGSCIVAAVAAKDRLGMHAAKNSSISRDARRSVFGAERLGVYFSLISPSLAFFIAFRAFFARVFPSSPVFDGYAAIFPACGNTLFLWPGEMLTHIEHFRIRAPSWLRKCGIPAKNR